jgi:hypothetical protein
MPLGGTIGISRRRAQGITLKTRSIPQRIFARMEGSFALMSAMLSRHLADRFSELALWQDGAPGGELFDQLFEPPVNHPAVGCLFELLEPGGQCLMHLDAPAVATASQRWFRHR